VRDATPAAGAVAGDSSQAQAQAHLRDDISAAMSASFTSLGPKPDSRQPGARFALFVLTLINLLNYIDRYVPSAVKDLVRGMCSSRGMEAAEAEDRGMCAVCVVGRQIKDDLKLSDAETSWPMTGMILVYMVASPFFGWIADKQVRIVALDTRSNEVLWRRNRSAVWDSLVPSHGLAGPRVGVVGFLRRIGTSPFFACFRAGTKECPGCVASLPLADRGASAAVDGRCALLERGHRPRLHLHRPIVPHPPQVRI
jgi:MFS family permease